MSAHVSTRQPILAAITVLASAALAAADVTVYKGARSGLRINGLIWLCAISASTGRQVVEPDSSLGKKPTVRRIACVITSNISWIGYY